MQACACVPPPLPAAFAHLASPLAALALPAQPHAKRGVCAQPQVLSRARAVRVADANGCGDGDGREAHLLPSVAGLALFVPQAQDDERKGADAGKARPAVDDVTWVGWGGVVGSRQAAAAVGWVAKTKRVARCGALLLLLLLVVGARRGGGQSCRLHSMHNYAPCMCACVCARALPPASKNALWALRAGAVPWTSGPNRPAVRVSAPRGPQTNPHPPSLQYGVHLSLQHGVHPSLEFGVCHPT